MLQGFIIFSKKFPDLSNGHSAQYIDLQNKVKVVTNRYPILKYESGVMKAIRDYFERQINDQELMDTLIDSKDEIAYNAPIYVEFIKSQRR